VVDQRRSAEAGRELGHRLNEMSSFVGEFQKHRHKIFTGHRKTPEHRMDEQSIRNRTTTFDAVTKGRDKKTVKIGRLSYSRRRGRPGCPGLLRAFMIRNLSQVKLFKRI
jgi:hypothetical protein